MQFIWVGRLPLACPRKGGELTPTPMPDIEPKKKNEHRYNQPRRRRLQLRRCYKCKCPTALEAEFTAVLVMGVKW